MEQIFGDNLPPKMRVSTFREILLANDNMIVLPVHAALVRGHFERDWLDQNDPQLARVLAARINRVCAGGSHVS
jgi:hypothetical protein